MLMAMESSCMEAPHRGLPQADAAIVRWNRGVRPYLERRRSQFLQQQTILEHAAGEHDSIDAARLANLGNGPARPFRNTAMKRPRHLCRGATVRAGFDQRGKQRPE